MIVVADGEDSHARRRLTRRARLDGVEVVRPGNDSGPGIDEQTRKALTRKEKQREAYGLGYDPADTGWTERAAPCRMPLELKQVSLPSVDPPGYAPDKYDGPARIVAVGADLPSGHSREAHDDVLEGLIADAAGARVEIRTLEPPGRKSGRIPAERPSTRWSAAGPTTTRRRTTSTAA